MSWSSYKDAKVLFESFRKFVSEDASATLQGFADDFSKKDVVSVVDFLNSPAGQDPKVRKALASGAEDGAPGDEVITVNEDAKPSVGDMVPTQNEISLMKSIGFPLSTLKSVKDVETGDITGRGGKIVSSGQLVIDGHHRWSSTWAVAGPDAKINAVDIGLPGSSPLNKLATAQVAIAATIDPNSGKLPSASAENVDDEGNPLPSDNILGKEAPEIAKMILDREGQAVPKADVLLGPEYLEKIKLVPEAQKYWGLKPDMTPDQVKGTIVSAVAGNLSQLPPPQGPERDYMPQFDGGDTHDGQVSLGAVTQKMQSGDVNYKSKFEESKRPRVTEGRLKQLVREELVKVLNEED
ncbi:MAG: hypothetical protein CL398_01125 [Acidiferrobacteraceae bacterium]|nr:hypothetical protein [Acidiferrobacteraceae bacterium]